MRKIASDIKNFPKLKRNRMVLRLNLLSKKEGRSSWPWFFTNRLDFNSKIIIASLVVVIIILGTRIFAAAPTNVFDNFVSAQTAGKSKEAEREELEAQLEELEKQISGYENTISEAKKQGKTLTSEIKILESKIAKTNLQIKSTEISLKKVSAEFENVANIVNQKDAEIAAQKNILARGLQNLYEEGGASLLEILLEYNRLSDFFGKMNSLADLQQANRETLDKVVALKAELDEKKDELSIKRRDTIALKQIQGIQKEDLTNKQSNKSNLLKTTQGNEKKYQQLLKKTRETAAQIRSRIYELMGIGAPITFGDAVKIANEVSRVTGVRTAFLLSVITQESELGKNVGTCNRVGDPSEKSWKKIMKPNRDQEPFKQIIAELNAGGIKMDIDTTPVSCPMKDKNGDYVGWGGAMGPAQFIPSTWILFEDRIRDATGHSVVSPWNVLDAFMGAAIYLQDLGADKGDYNSEWRAAMKYFSGSVNLRYRFYGDNVMSRVDDYENDIAAITN